MTRSVALRSEGRIRAAACVVVLVAAVAAAEALQAPTGVTVFRDVRLFDGVSIVEPATVVVKDGRVESVSEVPVLPADATVVDGKGLTLLPGLIDAHTHLSARRPWLEQALIFGVTTVLDLFSAPASVAPIREEQSTSGALGRADVYSAGYLVTSPGGHGTELDFRMPTISNPAEAQQFVDARIAEGSDYIKVVYDAYGVASNDALPTWRGRLPSIDRATLAAVIGAAHARGKLAVVHVLNLESARHAVAAGADGLAHMFVDERPDREFLAEAVRNDVFIIPTLSLLRGYTGVAKPQVVADPRVTAYLPPMSEAQLRIIGTMAHEIPDLEARLELLDASVAMLRRAGVRLLAGTDVPNPGTTHGAGLHEELAVLVDAGLSPLDALRAATSDVARAFRLTDRGRIEPGLRADLLLVRGDPTIDISAARDIVGVWKLGVQVDREAYRARYAPARSAYEAFVEALGSPGVTPLADFEHDEKMPTAVVGTWAPYSDIAYGGHSTSALSVVDKGAAGSAKSLLIRGSTVANEPFAGTGALYWPFGPVDLSSKSEIVFWAKGDRATYRIIMSNAGLTEVPVPQTFEVDDEWTEIVIPLSGFVGVDRRAVVTFAFLGSASPGEFLLQIDELRLR